MSYIAHSGTTPAAVCQLRGGATQSVLPTQKPRPPHFNEVEIVLKLVESFVPTPLTAVMIAMAIPAAIRPYSIAVAPVSSARNLRMVSIGVFYATPLKSR